MMDVMHTMAEVLTIRCKGAIKCSKVTGTEHISAQYQSHHTNQLQQGPVTSSRWKKVMMAPGCFKSSKHVFACEKLPEENIFPEVESCGKKLLTNGMHVLLLLQQQQYGLRRQNSPSQANKKLLPSQCIQSLKNEGQLQLHPSVHKASSNTTKYNEGTNCSMEYGSLTRDRCIPSHKSVEIATQPYVLYSTIYSALNKR